MKKPKVIIYDNDGMITCGSRFSDRYSKEFDVPMETLNPFFDGPFKKCLHGKADLKDELSKLLGDWKWEGSVEDLMNYWFDVGIELNQDVYDSITTLKNQGAIVCLATNQEKYRTDFLAKKFKYDELMNEIFSSAHLGSYKTSPESLLQMEKVLNDKYGNITRDEIMFWDDREGNVEILNKAEVNGQRYSDFESFKKVLQESGYAL